MINAIQKVKTNGIWICGWLKPVKYSDQQDDEANIAG